jgi:hypothetical protein
MAGGMAITVTERGKRTLRKFGNLGPKGRQAIREGLEQGATTGATYAFRSFRRRKQWGSSDSWEPNHGIYARFKANVLGQARAIPGQLSGELKNSMQIESRSPHKATPIPGGYETGFGTNVPYADDFTRGRRAHSFAVQHGGKVYRFYQGTAPRPFMPRPKPFRQVVRRIMRARLAEATREAMR